MARPKSDDKRSAILSAATRVIAAQGLGASTATIARGAGVSNGSLFTYFATKADLLNQLYLELKLEMAAAATGGLPTEGASRQQIRHMWSHWLRWAAASPEKRRTLAQLDVSDEVTAESHRTASQAMAGVAQLLEECRANGPLHEAPLSFVVTLMNAIAEATIDVIIHDPAHAEEHNEAGFDALWRIIA